ncbi:MAG: hypothetical protein HY238_22835 [Acidobacteria bacterium]|nr:hypothetical protein [Acidobacteriota bacterium]
MLLAFILNVSLAGWVPARWISPDPKNLELLKDTPINCLLLEREQWPLAEQAAQRGLVTLGVIRPGGDPREQARQAIAAHLSGIVLEGDFPAPVAESVRDTLAGSKVPVIEMLPRRSIRLREAKEIAATYQGVWPGIQVQENGATRAGPTGSPWFNTNAGFLLFARAATDAPIWVANLPPPQRVLPVESYLHSICDAAVLGARWVVALDDDFRGRLLAREEAALQSWRRMALYLRYFEEHPAWRGLLTRGELAVVQDADSGALVSGGILDMITVKHIPLRVVPRSKLSLDALRDSTMVLNLEAELLAPAQKQVLGQFTGAGNTMLTSPPEMKPPNLHGDEITLDEKEVGRIEDLWKGMNRAIDRVHPGVRLYNVSSMLSSLLDDRNGERLVLHLLNYSGYPIENVALHFPPEFRQVKMISPEGPARELEVYKIRDEGAADLDKVGVLATILLEKKPETSAPSASLR